MANRINFKCPHCGGKQLLSREVHIVQWFNIDSIHTMDTNNPKDSNTTVSYDILGACKQDGGTIESFECGDCDALIARGEADLYKFLKDNNMLGEEI